MYIKSFEREKLELYIDDKDFWKYLVGLKYIPFALYATEMSYSNISKGRMDDIVRTLRWYSEVLSDLKVPYIKVSLIKNCSAAVVERWKNESSQ